MEHSSITPRRPISTETPAFNFEPTKQTLTGRAGLSIAGRILQRLPLVRRLLPARPPSDPREIGDADVALSYLGLLVQGENDYDHIAPLRQGPFFQQALGIDQVPSSATLRQRLDRGASDPCRRWQAAMRESSDALLEQYVCPLRASGHWTAAVYCPGCRRVANG